MLLILLYIYIYIYVIVVGLAVCFILSPSRCLAFVLSYGLFRFSGFVRFVSRERSPLGDVHHGLWGSLFEARFKGR